MAIKALVAFPAAAFTWWLATFAMNLFGVMQEWDRRGTLFIQFLAAFVVYKAISETAESWLKKPAPPEQ